MGEYPIWDYIEVQDVKPNRKITLPPDLRGPDGVANFVLKPSNLSPNFSSTEGTTQEFLLWYYLMSAGVALLTTAHLKNPEYSEFGARKFYDNNEFAFPEKLCNRYLTYEVTEGEKVVFLAHEEMLAEEPRSVYVLNEIKALEYIDQANTEVDDLTEVLKKQPAFFGPV